VDWIDHGGLRACDQYALHCHPAVQQDEIGKNVCKIQSRLKREPTGHEDSLAGPNTDSAQSPVFRVKACLYC